MPGHDGLILIKAPRQALGNFAWMVTRMPVGAEPHKPKVLAKEAGAPAPQPKQPNKGDASKPLPGEKPVPADDR